MNRQRDRWRFLRMGYESVLGYSFYRAMGRNSADHLIDIQAPRLSVLICSIGGIPRGAVVQIPSNSAMGGQIASRIVT